MDRVKAAIFSTLGESVLESTVLDLFAGTGALGLEALSRGAAHATFVENDKAALDSLRRNIAQLKLGPSQVVAQDVYRFLAQAPSATYHIVFADPPYVKAAGDFDHMTALRVSEDVARVLAPNGLFILEIMPGYPLPPGPLEILDQRRYGRTEVVWLQQKGQP